MFTGIVECMGTITQINHEQSNVHYVIESPIGHELKIDQSVSHNGVCLTVVKLEGNKHTVTAIHETLEKTNLSDWKVGDAVNLERCMPANGRFDGHIVQGHVDGVAICTEVIDENGSWKYTFKYDLPAVTVEKGSITVNGTSLTVVNSGDQTFSVAIIPYTYENTVFKNITKGTKVNLEFDIIGKYVEKMLKIRGL
ncbi:MAG TPA: riboflavin synthase [Bacteroidia bacterium]